MTTLNEFGYEEKQGTPIGEHIDRVGKMFYQR